jgi:uncharacterized membrane protein
LIITVALLSWPPVAVAQLWIVRLHGAFMILAFQPLEPNQYLIAIWSAVIGTVIAVLYFVIRGYLCRTRGHNFEELDCFPGGKDTMTISYRCRRCGFKKYEDKRRAV